MAKKNPVPAAAEPVASPEPFPNGFPSETPIETAVETTVETVVETVVVQAPAPRKPSNEIVDMARALSSRQVADVKVTPAEGGWLLSASYVGAEPTGAAATARDLSEAFRSLYGVAVTEQDFVEGERRWIEILVRDRVESV